MSEIEKYIEFIKGNGPANRVFNPRFPIVLTESTASIISRILHDGYLEPKKLRVVYANKEEENLEHFKQNVIEMFNASKIEFGEIPSKGGIRINAPNIVGCVLVCFGLQPGNKLKNDVAIPETLLRCNKESVLSSFIGTMIADEACVTLFKSQRGGEIRLSLHGMYRSRPPHLLVHNKLMFNKVGIRTSDPRFSREKETKKKEKHYGWHIVICGQRNLLNFQKKVKIPLTRKQNLLNKIIDSYKI